MSSALLPDTEMVSCAESPSAMSARSSCAVTAGAAAAAVAAIATTAAKTALSGRKRDRFVFISPILDGLIRLLAVVATARDRCGRQPMFFVFHGVEERPRVRFAHLARLGLRVCGGLRAASLFWSAPACA